MGPEIVEPPAGSVAMEWRSPGFGTVAPQVRNAGLIPDAVRRAMEPTWGMRHYGEGVVRLHRLRDVFVIGEGLVFDRALRVFGIGMTQHSPGEAAVLRERLEAALAAGEVVEDRGVTLLCQKRGMRNFGHWLIELLPMAFLALRWLREGAWRVLAPAGERVVQESLAMIGVPAGQCVFGDGAPRHTEEVLVMEGLTLHGCYVSPLVMECMDALMAGVAATGTQPVWVSRRGRARALWNEAEVEGVLGAQGWRVVAPERLALRDQVAAFRGASRVAGVHGAGLAGAVFAPAGALVTSFAPAGMPDTLFWLLTTLRRQGYVEVRAPHKAGHSGVTTYDAALVLSLPELLRHLAP